MTPLLRTIGEKLRVDSSNPESTPSNVEPSKNNLVSIFNKFFQPTQNGRVRFRDYARESIGDLPKELSTAGEKVGGNIVSFGRNVLQETLRSIGSVGITATNVISKALGDDTVDKLSAPDNFSDPDDALKFVLFGEEPLESLGTRLKESPSRMKEFLTMFNIDAKEENLKNISYPGVLLLTALDFTGFGGSKNSFKVIAKLDKVDEIYDVVRGIFKGSDDKVVRDLAETFVNVNDEKVVEQIFESLGTKSDKLESIGSLFHGTDKKSAENILSKGVNPGEGVILGNQKLGNEIGFSLTNDKNIAKKFGDNILEFSISKDAKIADPSNLKDFKDLFQKFDDGKVLFNQIDIVKLAKEQGFDGVNLNKFELLTTDSKGFGEIQIFNPNVLKRADKIKSPVITVEDIAAIRNRYKIPGTTKSIETVGDGLSTTLSKERGFVGTVRESALTSPEVAKQVASNYNPINNKETFAIARQSIKSNLDNAIIVAKDLKAPATAESNAIAQLLIVDAQKAGRYSDAIELVEITAARATKQGQAIQSLSAYNRLTPEGILKFAQKQINTANKTLASGKQVKLTDDVAERLVKQAKKAGDLVDGTEEKLVQTGILVRDIAVIIPSNTAQKIAMTQTLGQLLNPKTLIRNYVGNTGFAAIENITDVVAVPFDSALSLLTGKRSKTLPSLLVQSDGFVQGLKEGARDALLGIDTLGLPTKMDLPRTPVFKGIVGRTAEKLLNIALRAPDRAAYKAAYDGSLYKQLKTAVKNGNIVDTPTEAMKEVAHHDGLYRTFQDENTLTFIFTNIKKALNAGKDFGIGDIVLKYPRTPANLLKRGIEYSPAGFVEMVYEASRPLIGKPFIQKAFVESFSRALVGSAGLVGGGALLHRLGIITGKKEDNKNINNVNRSIGLNQYQINASALKRFTLSGMDPASTKIEKDDTLYSYDWFQPAAIGLAMGADIDINNGELNGKSLITTLLEGIGAGADALGEQPLISNLARVLKFGDASDIIPKILEQVPASFVPTLLNQVKQLSDNTSRNTYHPEIVTQAIHRAQQRIPGLSEDLAPNVSVFGQDQEVYKDSSNNLFNVFFNPSFRSTYKPTPEAELVLDLFEATGETGQAPKLVNKTQTINGEKVKLGPQAIARLQRYTGTIARDYLHMLANSPQFQTMSDENKVKYMTSVLTSIGQAGKIVILGDRSQTRNPSAMTQQMIVQYLNAFPSSVNSLEAQKNKGGQNIQPQPREQFNLAEPLQ